MNHDYYIRLTLDLAKKGWPQVAPNPMVGCVIVKNGEVVTSGFHERFGGPHAEVNAINKLSSDISAGDFTLYVNLEPCSHFGKTPPCADLVISKGFKNVVIACSDPNPKVSGLGIKKLREAGINVTIGVLEKEARALNRRFISFFENKRPYYILKWAQTADGFISRTPEYRNNGVGPITLNQNKISGPEADNRVHQLRAEVMGIMVGKNTVLNDNPRLTTRHVEGKNPLRIFIDKNLEVPLSFNIYNNEAETIVFNSLKEERNNHIRLIKLNFNENVLQQISDSLYALNIQSVLVEGGKYLLDDFINQQLWDEILVFQNPDLHFFKGTKAPDFALKNTFDLVGNDKFYHHFKNETFLTKDPLEREVF